MTILTKSEVEYHGKDPIWLVTHVVNDFGRRAAGFGLIPGMYVMDRGTIVGEGGVRLGKQAIEKVNKLKMTYPNGKEAWKVFIKGIKTAKKK